MPGAVLQRSIRARGFCSLQQFYCVFLGRAGLKWMKMPSLPLLDAEKCRLDFRISYCGPVAAVKFARITKTDRQFACQRRRNRSESEG
jgi:hypothetical protein